MWFMCRIKKITAALMGLTMTISLGGCGLAETLVTDTGSGKKQEIAREDYLKLDVLEQEEQTVEDIYQIITLTKSTFEEEALNQILRRSYINVPTVRFELDGIPARLGEYVAEYLQYVEEGDVIATAYTEVDEIALNEAKVKLQRLQERRQAAQEQAEEDLAKLEEEGKTIYDDYDEDIHRIKITQRQQDWENTKYNYDRQIEDAREALNKLTQVGKVYEIKAPVSGHVFYSRKYVAGDELKEGDYICHIMSSNVVYTSTEQQAEYFYYGMDVTFDNRNGLTPATVVNGGSWILYGNLDTKETIFKLEFDKDISELDQTGLNNLVLKASLKTVENVIVIPKKAVTVEEEQYFVTVLKEDGTLLKTEFLPGGSDVENYWVLEGLTEGMQIVYN